MWTTQLKPGDSVMYFSLKTMFKFFVSEDHFLRIFVRNFNSEGLYYSSLAGMPANLGRRKKKHRAYICLLCFWGNCFCKMSYRKLLNDRGNENKAHGCGYLKRNRKKSVRGQNMDHPEVRTKP